MCNGHSESHYKMKKNGMNHQITQVRWHLRRWQLCSSHRRFTQPLRRTTACREMKTLGRSPRSSCNAHRSRFHSKLSFAVVRCVARVPAAGARLGGGKRLLAKMRERVAKDGSRSSVCRSPVLAARGSQHKAASRAVDPMARARTLRQAANFRR